MTTIDLLWARGVLGVTFLDAVGLDESDVKMAVDVAPRIVLLSLAIVQANGSLVPATEDDERPKRAGPLALHDGSRIELVKASVEKCLHSKRLS